MRVPQAPPTFSELMVEVGPERLLEVVTSATGASDSRGQYRHWDTMRRIRPPAPLSSHEWWLTTKFARRQLYKSLPLRTRDGQHFQYAMTDAAWEMLHAIDQRAGGEISFADPFANPATRNRYVVSSLIEEAITSSQLEGAVTTRVEAKEMIRSGREPRTVDERMVLNNFEAINFVREVKDQRLTPELVVKIQELLTRDTLHDERHVGHIQEPGEDRARVEDNYGTVMHQPPPAEELPGRIEAMCAFANGDGDVGFVHPVVRAVLLHLWLAYDHPFADGNGRTARALFYWALLHNGYWLAEFLSISRILRNAPSKYGKSFLYVETDEYDATYFLLYQLRVLCRSIDDLHIYLERKMTEVREVESVLRTDSSLNYRQLALLSHALRHPGARYTFDSHALSHNVVYQSARSDLLSLEGQRFLVRRKIGRQYVFSAAPDLPDRLKGD